MDACASPDAVDALGASIPLDAGAAPVDAGTPDAVDALGPSIPLDAGAASMDAGTPDAVDALGAPTPMDASVAPVYAGAPAVYAGAAAVHAGTAPVDAGTAPAPPAGFGMTSEAKKTGSLVVVGTGIRTVGHLTMEALAWMQRADEIIHLVADPVAETLIAGLKPGKEFTLQGFYGEGKPRAESYNEMIEFILSHVRAGVLVRGAFYGYPGVFAYPPHESIRRARAEGYAAWMLPGISAEDCLFADLGVDPAVGGCQSYEATDFLINRRIIDPSSQLSSGRSAHWAIGLLPVGIRSAFTAHPPLQAPRTLSTQPRGWPLRGSALSRSRSGHYPHRIGTTRLSDRSPQHAHCNFLLHVPRTPITMSSLRSINC